MILTHTSLCSPLCKDPQESKAEAETSLRPLALLPAAMPTQRVLAAPDPSTSHRMSGITRGDVLTTDGLLEYMALKS